MVSEYQDRNVSEHSNSFEKFLIIWAESFYYGWSRRASLKNWLERGCPPAKY